MRRLRSTATNKHTQVKLNMPGTQMRANQEISVLETYIWIISTGESIVFVT